MANLCLKTLVKYRKTRLKDGQIHQLFLRYDCQSRIAIRRKKVRRTYEKILMNRTGAAGDKTK